MPSLRLPSRSKQQNKTRCSKAASTRPSEALTILPPRDENQTVGEQKANIVTYGRHPY
jgi:hypothetical protein